MSGPGQTPDEAGEASRGARRPRTAASVKARTIELTGCDEAEEAASFYTSVFENSRIVNVTHYTEAGPRPAGTVMTVQFELDGQRFVAINGGPQFTFDEAVSFEITCERGDRLLLRTRVWSCAR